MTPIYIAFLCALVACGPKADVRGPGDRPTAIPAPSSAAPPAAAAQAPPGTSVLLGEWCPAAVGNRSAVWPVVLRTVRWEYDSDALNRTLERAMARQFAIMRWDGTRAGWFQFAGTSRIGYDRKVAQGSYAGGDPCALPTEEGGTTLVDNAVCVATQNRCGLALSALNAQRAGLGDLDTSVSFPTGGACRSGDALLIDIDGDGTLEAYGARQFLTSMSEPASEVTTVPVPSKPCEARFASRHILAPGHPRVWKGLDLLGVVDLDGDGRFELIMAYRYPNRSTWAIYSATASASRLDLVAESEPWPRGR